MIKKALILDNIFPRHFPSLCLKIIQEKVQIFI